MENDKNYTAQILINEEHNEWIFVDEDGKKGSIYDVVWTTQEQAQEHVRKYSSQSRLIRREENQHGEYDYTYM